jgi:hypothetical protein
MEQRAGPNAAEQAGMLKGRDDCRAFPTVFGLIARTCEEGAASIPSLLVRPMSFDQSSPLPAGVSVSSNGQTWLANFNIKRPLSWHVLQSVPLLAFK